MPKDPTTVIVVDDGRIGIDRLAEFAMANLLAERVPMIVIDAPPAIDAAMHAARLAKECNEIVRHPRYQDRTPRSPKPRFRKRR